MVNTHSTRTITVEWGNTSMTSEYKNKSEIYIYYQDESLKIKTNTILNQNRIFVRRGLSIET